MNTASLDTALDVPRPKSPWASYSVSTQGSPLRDLVELTQEDTSTVLVDDTLLVDSVNEVEPAPEDGQVIPEVVSEDHSVIVEPSIASLIPSAQPKENDVAPEAVITLTQELPVSDEVTDGKDPIVQLEVEEQVTDETAPVQPGEFATQAELPMAEGLNQTEEADDIAAVVRFTFPSIFLQLN